MTAGFVLGSALPAFSQEPAQLPLGDLRAAISAPLAEMPANLFETQVAGNFKIIGVGYAEQIPTSVWSQTSLTAPKSTGTGYICFSVVNRSNQTRTAGVRLTIKDPTGARSVTNSRITQPGNTMYLWYFLIDWDEIPSAPSGIYEGAIRSRRLGRSHLRLMLQVLVHPAPSPGADDLDSTAPYMVQLGAGVGGASANACGAPEGPPLHHGTPRTPATPPLGG